MPTRRPIMLLCALCLLAAPVLAQNAPAAPPPLEVRALTTRAEWREVNKSQDLHIRCITNQPATATVEAPLLSLKATEPYPGQNHRLDLRLEQRDCPPIRLTLTTPDGRQLVNNLTPTPPPPYPAMTPAGRVELTVQEPSGQDRLQAPVTFGLPLAKGALYWPNNVNLLAGSTRLPLQTRAESRWEDQSIKWLLLDTQLDLKGGAATKLVLEYGGRAAALATSQTLKVTAMSGRGGVVVESGKLAAVLPLVGQPELRLGTQKLAGLGSTLTAADGAAYDFVTENVEVLEPGPLRAQVRLDGHFARGDQKHFAGSVLVTCFAGKPYARVGHVFGNDLVKDNMTAIRSLYVNLSDAATASALVSVAGGQPLSVASGTEIVQQFDDRYAARGSGSDTGKRLGGCLTSGALAVGVKDFWQQYPKSWDLGSSGLRLGLCPTIAPQNLYANNPAEEKLTYYLRDGSYTFKRGLRKRHEFWVGPASEAAEVAALAGPRVTVVAPPRYYQDVAAIGDILPAHPEHFAMYDEIMSRSISRYDAVQDSAREYGLMNWGDWFGERGLNWGNIEYDLQVGLLQQYLRTGDPRFFHPAEAASRHNTDIDTIHWAPPPPRAPDQSLEPVVGEIWVHSMGHTGGYYPSGYKNMEVYAQGYSTNRGHMWTGGNFLYGMLTGDPLVLESARLAADWMAGPNTARFDFGNAREPGWMGIAVMSAYRATRDPYYLNAADIMLAKVHEKAQATRPEYGLYYHKLSGGHCDCPEGQKHYGEANFMAGVLMTAMHRYYQETGDERVAKDIEGISRFLVETMWSPEDGAFRYTSCPKTSPGASSAAIICEGMAFAANRTNNAELREIIQTAVGNAMVALETSVAGKASGYMIHSFPALLVEMDKFPGPSFAELYTRMQAEATAPALVPVPGLIPNPDFEEGVMGWVSRQGYKLEHCTEVSHTGRGSAKFTGTGSKQGEYIVTKYACGSPWEMMGLKPGRKYRLVAWLRVDEITPGVPVSLRCATRDHGQTRAAFATNTYDHSKPGTWQRLVTEFTAPDYTTSAYVAVNLNTLETMSIVGYLDDVAVVPAELPDAPTVLYPAATAEEAKLGAGVSLQQVKGPVWRFAAPGKSAGTAEFQVQVPEAGRYALTLRGRAIGPNAVASISCDGRPLGKVESTATGWQWLAPQTAQPLLLDLQPGPHVVTVQWPVGSALGVHKVVLTNDTAPH